MKKNVLVLVLKNSAAGSERYLRALKAVLLTWDGMSSEQRAVPFCGWVGRCSKSILLSGGALCTTLSFFLSWYQL